MISKKAITEKFDYDLIKWLDNKDNLKLFGCKLSTPIEYTFGFTEDQIIVRKDQSKRYGSDLNALSKIVTRIAGLESQFRKVKHDENKELRNIYKKIGDEWATKYAMSG